MGNIAGLLGTVVLGIAAFRAIPVARRLYGISRELLTLAERREQKEPLPASKDLQAADPVLVAQLLERLSEHEKAYETLLAASAGRLNAQKNAWTRWDTCATVLGFFLTLSSDVFPLVPQCPSAACLPTQQQQQPGQSPPVSSLDFSDSDPACARGSQHRARSA